MSDNLTILTGHALIEHKLTQMRHKDCPVELFRSRMREIGALLALAVTADLKTDSMPIETPLEAMNGKRLHQAPVVVPILRAALGLADGLLSVLTEAHVGHIGVYRDEDTLQPHQYLAKLPPLNHRDVIVVDPMLATGHSAAYAIDLLIKNGADPERIIFTGLVASPEGVKELQSRYPSLRIVLAALDRELNEKGYIMPGLGDAGDRLYGTM